MIAPPESREAEIHGSATEAVTQSSEENPVDLDGAVGAIEVLLAKVDEHSIEALKAYRDIGSLLLDVKARQKEGTFSRWIKTFLSFSHRNGQRYMRIAKEWPRIEQEINSGRMVEYSIRAVERFLDSKKENDLSSGADLPLCQPDTDPFIKEATRLIRRMVALRMKSPEMDSRSGATLSESQRHQLELIQRLLQQAESCDEELKKVGSSPPSALPLPMDHVAAEITSDPSFDSHLEVTSPPVDSPSNVTRTPQHVTQGRGRGRGASKRPATERTNPIHRC